MRLARRVPRALTSHGVKRRSFTRGLAVLAIVAPALLAAVGPARASTSILDPGGPRADTIARLFWVLIVPGAIVFVVMMLLFLIGAWRRGSHDARGERANGTRTVAIFGVALPAVVLIFVFGYTLWSLLDLSEPASAADDTIEIEGHQWWWEVRYTDRDFVTANEIHIPVGKPVHLELTSADVIHSFWVPELSDKIDMIPGHTNSLWLQADKPGTYRGQCAEFCGAQHAQMAFLVIADSPDDYDAWVAQQQAPAEHPSSDVLVQGEQIFLGSACIYCHAVKGTAAQGKLGPDLTHLASRDTLAAGAIANTDGNLAGWILNPQSIKPGTKMPPVDMPAEDLQKLLTYLESLD